MATYAVGDIQGCFGPFRRLLARLRFDSVRDRLWLVGDVVNRGPQSYEMLRWAYQHRSHVRAVLGNHDLHILRRHAGLSKKKKRDTADDLLDAPDATRLLDWVATWPFAYREGKHLMVHAGLRPEWDAQDVLRISNDLQRELREDPRGFLGRWAETEAGTFTLTRMVNDEGDPDFHFKGPPELAPPGLMPWFDHPERRSTDHTIVCGHWAALGLHLKPGLAALDSGCVWGQVLTAYRLEDGAVFQVPAEPH